MHGPGRELGRETRVNNLAILSKDGKHWANFGSLSVTSLQMFTISADAAGIFSRSGESFSRSCGISHRGSEYVASNLEMEFETKFWDTVKCCSCSAVIIGTDLCNY